MGHGSFDLSRKTLSNNDEKKFDFLFLTTLNVPEMRPLGTFQSIFSNGYHGNDDH